VNELSIVHIYPTVLGLYGDRGNTMVLAHRARARGYDVTTIIVDPGDPVPATADIYLLGGAEDLAQVKAVELLKADGNLAQAVAANRPVLAICAAFQVMGVSFPAGGKTIDGLGLLDVATVPGTPRAVGEVVTEPIALDLPTMTGYENHGGRTRLGPDAAPLARVVSGIGNGTGDGTEGALQGSIIASYLHGPVLARNPALADVLLERAIGKGLPPMEEPLADQLRTERLNAYRR
jgi:lipid II isoglutaminyl synthase (glutamine-hydrolysing)